MAKSWRERFGQVFGRNAGPDNTKGTVLTYVEPAPGLTPPGMGGTQPQQQAPAMESREETERRMLQEGLQARVRGEVTGRGSLMDKDWEAMKLAEAKSLQLRRAQTEKDLAAQADTYRKGLAERGRKLDEKMSKEQSRQQGRDREQERD